MGGVIRRQGDGRGFAGVSLNLDLETFLLDFELGQIRALHEVDDEFDLLEVQMEALVEIGRLSLVSESEVLFKRSLPGETILCLAPLRPKCQSK